MDYTRQNIVKATIKSTITITQLVEHITLQQADNGKICCPFHNEKTPSFILDDNKKLYHCLGCGTGGDIFTFVSDYYKIGFNEAVAWIDNEFHLGLLNARVSVAQQIEARKRKKERERLLADEERKQLEYDTICLDYRIAHRAKLLLEPFSDLWCYYVNQLTYLDYLIEKGGH